MVGTYDRYLGRWSCDCGGRSFPHESALRQHLANSPKHSYCFKCDRDFTSDNGRRQHWTMSSAHSFCEECGEDFDDNDELHEHYDDEHHFCERCEEVYWTYGALEEHYKGEHHYCEDCEEVFWTHGALENHDVQRHFYCAPYDRYFESAASLHSHKSSAVHKPKDIPCPLRGCSAKFGSRSALVQHWESGGCPGGITRHMIDKYVRKYDVKGQISSQLLIAGGTSNNPPPIYVASERAWNGDAYECYFCHSEFTTLAGLNQHLNSPKHSGPGTKAYHCPKPGNSCNSHFPTLGALVQHVESGKCGVQRFKEVKDAMDKLLKGVKRITL